MIGVVGGTADVPYLPEPLPVTDELLALAGPVAPQEVFRFAAPCACSGCGHFAKEESKCRLAEGRTLGPDRGREAAALLNPPELPLVAARRQSCMPALPAGGHP